MFVGASLPGGTGRGQDRWWTTGHAAVVLDGASSYLPTTADASTYVDHLITTIGDRLLTSCGSLGGILAESIHHTAEQLKLTPGVSPSSTVLVARRSAQKFEVLVLGDSTALVKTKNGQVHRFSDERLSTVATDVRRAYRARLQSGAGFDEEHRQLLCSLQERQHRVRNKPDGYWIAEADSKAAAEAQTYVFHPGQVMWCVLATDGAQRPIDHLGFDWEQVATMGTNELRELLRELHRWEESDDPGAKLMPRAKRHDDKAIVRWAPDCP